MIYVIGPLSPLFDVHREISRNAGFPRPGQGVDPMSWRGLGSPGWTEHATEAPKPTTTPGEYAIPVTSEFAACIPATLPDGVTLADAVELVPQEGGPL